MSADPRSCFQLFFFLAWTVTSHEFTKQGTKNTVHALFTGLTVLFTHLKIILLQCFQFSVSTKISYIQTDPKYVWLGGERRRKWWDRAVFFFSGTSKFNSSKMERKLGENRWVDGIIYLPLILPHNNIINSTLCIFFFQ